MPEVGDTKTVGWLWAWSKSDRYNGKIPIFRTPGSDRRIFSGEVDPFFTVSEKTACQNITAIKSSWGGSFVIRGAFGVFLGRHAVLVGVRRSGGVSRAGVAGAVSERPASTAGERRSRRFWPIGPAGARRSSKMACCPKKVAVFFSIPPPCNYAAPSGNLHIHMYLRINGTRLRTLPRLKGLFLGQESHF